MYSSLYFIMIPAVTVKLDLEHLKYFGNVYCVIRSITLEIRTPEQKTKPQTNYRCYTVPGLGETLILLLKQ